MSKGIRPNQVLVDGDEAAEAAAASEAVRAPSTVRRIENNTSAYLVLPPAGDVQVGFRLMPGLNTVPVKYLDALLATKGGAKALELLQVPINIRKASGEHWGPQITVHLDPLADRDDGPPAPASLPRNEDAAMAIIAATRSVSALKRWSEQGQSKVNQAAGAKLNAIRNGAP